MERGVDMLNILKIDGYTVTVEGTWYEVSNGYKVVEYGHVVPGTTPQEVYSLLKEQLAQDAALDNGITFYERGVDNA